MGQCTLLSYKQLYSRLWSKLLTATTQFQVQKFLVGCLICNDEYVKKIVDSSPEPYLTPTPHPPPKKKKISIILLQSSKIMSSKLYSVTISLIKHKPTKFHQHYRNNEFLKLLRFLEFEASDAQLRTFRFHISYFKKGFPTAQLIVSQYTRRSVIMRSGLGMRFCLSSRSVIGMSMAQRICKANWCRLTEVLDSIPTLDQKIVRCDL